MEIQARVEKIAEQVNALLTASVGFQQYFSIVDGDIERFQSDPTEGKRLFRLPVYHIENLLLDENEIFEVTRIMMSSKCPYSKADEVRIDLQKLVFSDGHLKAFTKSLLDSRLAKLAKDAHDAVYKQKSAPAQQNKIPVYSEIEEEAKRTLESALKNDTWQSKCKGRDLLKSYCGQHGLKYEHFRNLLISRISTPPKPLTGIMNQILKS